MAWALAAAVSFSLLAVAVRAYRRDLRAARARVLAGSGLVETTAGPIEYGALGKGAPILVLHGAGGGWDQGLLAASGLIAQRFRLVAPSRFGYLRTPLPADASPEAEADTWVRFLDAVQVQCLPVVAFSAGAAPAVQLALRHPTRVSALVLLIGDDWPRPNASPPRALLNLAYRFDFPAWILEHVAPRFLQRLLALPPSPILPRQPALPPDADEAVGPILPVSARRLGVLNDVRTAQKPGALPLDQVRVPKLLLQAADDVLWSATSSFLEREALREAS